MRFKNYELKFNHLCYPASRFNFFFHKKSKKTRVFKEKKIKTRVIDLTESISLPNFDNINKKMRKKVLKN